jgi:branched-chain amino acid transport system permease protein
MSLAFILNILITGALAGLVYGLAAVGLAMVFGALRVINFAHGGLMVAGMYGAAMVANTHGTDPLWALPMDATGLFVFGILVQRLILNRVLTVPEPTPSLLLAGLTLGLAGGLAMLFGGPPRGLHLPYVGDTLVIGPFSLDRLRVRAAWVAVLGIIALFLFFNISRTGKAIRACADNPFGARVAGLNLGWLQAVVFGLGAGVAGVAGCLLTQIIDIGPELMPECFATVLIVTLIGGFDSTGGVLVAGLLVGMVEALAEAFWAPAFQSLAGYGLLILVLGVRALKPARQGLADPEEASALEGRHDPQEPDPQGEMQDDLWGLARERAAILFETGVDALAWGLGHGLGWLGSLPERLARGTIALCDDVLTATTWQGRVLGLGAVSGLVTLPEWAEPQTVTVVASTLWLAYVGQAWNVVSGFAGPLSLGHTLFVGLGAYFAAGLCLHWGVSCGIAIILVTPLVGLIGTILGALALRTERPELSFAILTLTGAEACRVTADHLESVGGALGWLLSSAPVTAAHPASDPHNNGFGSAYSLILLLTLTVLVIIQGLSRSGLGYRWRAARDNPMMAAAIGVNVFRTRLSAMAISAALTAPAGVFLAFSSGSLVPDSVFSASQSLEIALCAVIGGLGTVLGPVVGAFVLLPLDQGLAWLAHRLGHPVPGLTLFGYGIVLMLLVWLRSGGVWPWLAQALSLIPVTGPPPSPPFPPTRARRPRL